MHTLSVVLSFGGVAVLKLVAVGGIPPAELAPIFTDRLQISIATTIGFCTV